MEKKFLEMPLTEMQSFENNNKYLKIASLPRWYNQTTEEQTPTETVKTRLKTANEAIAFQSKGKAGRERREKEAMRTYEKTDRARTHEVKVETKIGS